MTSNKFNQYNQLVINEVLQRFGFLQHEYNYLPPVISQQNKDMSTDYINIKYKSLSSYFDIFYASMESELSIEIGLLKQLHENYKCKEGFSLNDSLFFLGFKDILPVHIPHARSEYDIKSVINYTADIVQKYLYKALSNPSIIKEWIMIREQINGIKIKQYLLNNTRKKAIDAWRNNNYQEVSLLYNSMLEDLTKLEQKRLDYATKLITKEINIG